MAPRRTPHRPPPPLPMRPSSSCIVWRMPWPCAPSTLTVLKPSRLIIIFVSSGDIFFLSFMYIHIHAYIFLSCKMQRQYEGKRSTKLMNLWQKQKKRKRKYDYTMLRCNGWGKTSDFRCNWLMTSNLLKWYLKLSRLCRISSLRPMIQNLQIDYYY